MVQHTTHSVARSLQRFGMYRTLRKSQPVHVLASITFTTVAPPAPLTWKVLGIDPTYAGKHLTSVTSTLCTAAHPFHVVSALMTPHTVF